MEKCIVNCLVFVVFEDNKLRPKRNLGKGVNWYNDLVPDIILYIICALSYISIWKVKEK